MYSEKKMNENINICLTPFDMRVGVPRPGWAEDRHRPTQHPGARAGWCHQMNRYVMEIWEGRRCGVVLPTVKQD